MFVFNCFSRVRNILTITLLLLSACSDERSVWNGKFESLPNAAQSCVISWTDNFYIINKLETFMHSQVEKPKKVIVAKSGISDKAAYAFFGVLEFNDKYSVIYTDLNSFNVKDYEFPNEKISSLIDYFELGYDFRSEIVNGRTANLSHVPCEFIYFKSSSKELFLAYIGLFSDYTGVAGEFHRFKSDFLKRIERSSVDDSTQPINYIEMDKLEGKMKENIFFEFE